MTKASGPKYLVLPTKRDLSEDSGSSPRGLLGGHMQLVSTSSSNDGSFESTTASKVKFWTSKGQLISKAIYGVLDSPKKR